LVLRARVIPVNPMLETIKNENNYNGSRATTTNDGASANAAVFYPNTISELQDADQIFCVSIRSEPFWSDISPPRELYGKGFPTPEETVGNEMIIGLTLVQGPTNNDVYRRVGLMRWVRKSLFTGVEPLVITLV
jgi:hypothetical protein